MIFVKQSTAVTLVVGPFLDETDGKTAETALTISQADVRLSKNAGAFAQKNDATSATHMENGNYSVPLNTTDTNTLGVLRLHVSESGALPVWVDIMVMPANVWDSLFGSDKLQIDAVELLGTAFATPAVAGRMSVDVIAISGDTTSADNLEAFTDGTGYAGGTIKLQVDAVAVSGDTVAADNLEAAYDGAGYAGGTIKQQVDVRQWIGTNVATPTVAGVPEVDTTHWNGGAVAATTISGVPEVNTTYWNDSAVAVPTVPGVPEIDVTHWNGSAIATPDAAGYPKVTLKTGTGAGELSVAAGVVSADAVAISGDAPAANNLEAALDGTGGVTISASLSGSVGSVTGAVGSVTGAVGSVLGNVGGNVVGSVGSVAGGVGGNVAGSVGSVVGSVGSVVATVAADAILLDSGDVTATIADAVANILGDTLSLEDTLKVLEAVLTGPAVGQGTFFPKFRNRANTKDRLSATLTDGLGNRGVVTLDLT